MILSYKIRIYPNKTQINKCLNMFGGCRFVYNQYINYNIRRYENNEKFISWREYRKIIKDMRNSDYVWLKELYKHSLDFSVKNANEAFKRFFAGISGFPKFKSRKSPVQSFYLDSCDKMVILVTQRVGTIKEADKIIVIDEGKIESIGNYETLENSSKVFKEFIDSQKREVA